MSPQPTNDVSPRQFKLPQKISRRTQIIAIIVLCVIAAGSVAVCIMRRTEPESKKRAVTTMSTQATDKPAAKTTLRFIASGDTIAHDALNAQAKQSNGSYDYYQFMEPLKQYFDKADVRFCNQAVPGGGTAFPIRGYPVFNSPLEVAHGMAKLGCNVINTGTNHTFDMGQAVIDAELNDWDTLPDILAVAGANRSTEEQNTIRYFTVQGVKFAFVSYTTYSNITPPNSYGLNMFNEATAEREVGEARNNADIVMVSMRWGAEYSPGINAEQVRDSQLLAQWGADVVLGHGPHVLAPVKLLPGKDGRNTLVWYSLGNFLNAQIPTESLVSGLAVMDIDIATKKILPPKYLPIYMHYEWTADEKAREDLLKRHAFTMVPLDQAEDLLARSQNNTTVEAQTQRVQSLLNQFTSVTLLNSTTY